MYSIYNNVVNCLFYLAPLMGAPQEYDRNLTPAHKVIFFY